MEEKKKSKLSKCFDHIDEIEETKGLTLLQRSQTKPTDEYYTQAETVERIEEAIRPYIKGCKIWCPFDADYSQFVQVLKAKGYEVINTSDDYKNHLEEIKASGAVVLSNPPFSIWRGILKDLQEIGVDFFLLNNLINAVPAYKKGAYGFYVGSLEFDTPENIAKPKSAVPCFLMSNKDIRGTEIRPKEKPPQKTIDGVPFWRTITDWVEANKPTPAFVPSTFILSAFAKLYDFEVQDRQGYFYTILIKGVKSNDN